MQHQTFPVPLKTITQTGKLEPKPQKDKTGMVQAVGHTNRQRISTAFLDCVEPCSTLSAQT